MTDIVLSDDLIKLFNDFQKNKISYSENVRKLLSMYKPHLTNVSQLDRVSFSKNNPIYTQLATKINKDMPLEELTKDSTFKLILNESKSNFPYVSINGDEIESNYTGTFKKVSRTKAIAHLKALCSNAKHVFIYDKYISQRQVCREVLPLILPNKNITIFSKDSQIPQDEITVMKKGFEGWTFKKDTTNPLYNNLHDRYLIIDNKIEVILTSGFDGLINNDKDFSYIVRKVK